MTTQEKRILNFRNEIQVVLWNQELCGQISDGHWENARPNNHWQAPCKAEVSANPENLGRNFHSKKESYNFASKELLEVVSKRMIGYVRLYKLLGDKAKPIYSLVDCDGKISRPEYSDHASSTYWADKRATFDTIDPAHIKAAEEDETIYNHKQLLADLKDMKEIYKMRNGYVY